MLDITQLDVTWLYDSFPGGGTPPEERSDWEQRNWALNSFSPLALPHASAASSSSSSSSSSSQNQEEMQGGSGCTWVWERLGWEALAEARRVDMRH